MTENKSRRRLYLCHWHPEEAEELADALRPSGWEIKVIHNGDQLRPKKLREEPPLAFIISLRRLPSHGKKTAQFLWSAKWRREIPILFFDGVPEKVEALRDIYPEATFTSWEALTDVLTDLTSNEPG
jgi:hypothetical protein